MINQYAKTLLIAFALVVSSLGYSQQYNSFDIRYQDNIRGDLTFIANNIVNRDGGTGSTEPEDPYNATGNSSTYNDWLNMQYIDVDSDPTTFSSSTATFAFPQASCNLIRYAGLYWAATYPSEQAGQPIGTNRQNDFNQVKLMLPGSGTYVDITADEVLFDGFTSTDPSVQQNSPYACYADITALITAMADPTGDYTVANIRSVVGSLSPGGGASGGWTIIIAYENPTLTGKLITTFDGFARVRSDIGSTPIDESTVNINYTGFNTIPVGPVRANIGAAALEGDNRITGDRMQIRAASNPSFTNISNPVNPASNFFNSNITLNGAITNNRTPNSINTLGYDTDMFLLNNPANSIIPNTETDATFRFRSTGDQYYPFYNSFNVEIIEPNIIVEKRVEDIGGNDITGLGVNLGQFLDYVLTFQNLGNDDATNYVLRDVLPVNVTLIESNMVLPPGVTYVYDPVAHEVVFNIPDNLVEQGDPQYDIRMRVRVAENCFDFIDACSDLIANQAYSTYQGVINDAVITDDPSVSDFDNCGFVTPGATNFLLDDLESCDYSRTVQLCGDDVLLDAGDNFDAYIWYRDENMNSLIDAGDTLIDDGDPDSDPSTMLVTEVGIYIVDKQVADPCKGFQEIITVEYFGATQTNPIVDLINDTTNTVEGEVVVCPNDGDLLPRIFLCGLNDTELIQINIPDAQSIEWEQLDEASCPPAVDDCANKDSGCTWNNVGNGNNYLAQDPGKYRVVINYQNGCFSRFYFDIFKNPLDPQYNVTDIICTTPGNITVTNMPADYEYQLLDGVTGTILVPYGPSPSFTINNNGAYTVEIRQQGVVDGCIFRLENIGVLERNFQVVITTKDTDCNGLGEISISALDVEPQYYYEISQGGVTVDTYGPSVDNNYTFLNLNDGVYDVLVTTDDGCSYTEQVTINDVTDLAVNAVTTKPIDCTDGIITVTGSGGFPNPDYQYAIWSYNGVTSYTDITDVPGSEFQVENDFTFTNGEEGDYVFVVVDGNNCWVLSNTATITVAPAVTYTTTAVDETCLGGADGSFTVNVTNYNGYTVTYTLTYPDTSTVTNSSGVFTGLGQGNYSLTLTQTNGTDTCDFIETFTIGGPVDSVTGTAVLIQDYTCLQLGIIEAQGVTGGSPPYEYSIDGVNFASGAGAETFSNLTDGTYNISIRDANGCVFVSNPVTIDPLDPPTDLTFTATPPNCPTQTSDVVATVVDGNAPFVFEIIAPAPVAATSITGNTADFDGLAPGTYTFRVTDDKGCIYDEDFTINPVVPIDVVGQLVSNVTCAGDTDGEVLFTVSGFATSYDYNVTGPALFSGSAETSAAISLTNLPAGTYDITVTDNDTNCTDTASVTVNEPLPLVLAANEVQPTCTTTGSVVLTATDGWGSYTYSVTFPDTVTIITNSTGSFTGLNQNGTYIAAVTDANGCVVTTNFVLNAAVPPILAITPNDVCYDDAVGLTLTANVTSGGDGNFEYRINGGPWDANNIFAGLTSGTYTVDVRDGNDCTGTDTITINPELSVTASAPSITACGTTSDVTITAAGGDGNYVYAVVADGVPPIPADFGAANPVTVTGAGDYDVYVRDNNGAVTYCEAMFDITIVQDAPLVITPVVTPNICFGDSNGSITLNVTNGMAPYEYSIDNGTNYQSSNLFVNLPAATYPVRVRDSNGCEETASVVVTEPTQITAEATQTQAYTCLQFGEITVGSIIPTAGGSGDYQYSINGGAWTPSTTGSHVFTNLIDGTYSIRVRDANAVSCVITIPDVIIPPLPTEPTLSTSITYNCDGTGNITVLPNDPGYTYSLDAGAPQASNVFNNVAVGSHTITVDYGSNCTVDTIVQVEDGNAFNSNITAFSNLLCNADASGSITFEVENFDLVNGFEFEVNGGGFSAPQFASPVTVNGLSAGANTIVVRDVLDNSCSVTLNQNLTEPSPVVASAVISQEMTCTNGGATITASAVGGTPAYEYQLEDDLGGIITAYQPTTFFTGIAPGDYIVRVRDTNNCQDPIDAVITVNPPDIVTFTTTPTACYSGNNDAAIQVDVTGGNGLYQFSINSGPWMIPTPSSATTYTFTNLSAGNYTIDVRDQYGCVGVQQNVTINPQLLANAVLTADLTCIAPASVTVNASGGSGAYTYEWSNDGGTNWFNTNFVGNVFSTNTDGTYEFRVTDTTVPTACTVISNSIIVSPADTPIITTVNPTHNLCNGDSIGVLDVVIDTSVGSPPYVINVVETITTTNYGTQTTGLPAGDYEVTITDSKGCVSMPFAVTINEPTVINPNITSTNLVCNAGGTQLGTITVDAAGGTPTYIYEVYNSDYSVSLSYDTSSGTNDHTFTGLDFGDYTVSVTDANGCEDLYTVTITTGPDVLITTQGAAGCTPGSGEMLVEAQASNGTLGVGSFYFAVYPAPPFNILDPAWFPEDPSPPAPANSHLFTGLTPGVTYTFIVHDADTNCEYLQVATVPVSSTSTLISTIDASTDVSCTGSADGTVDFTISGYGGTDVDYEIFVRYTNVTTTITGTVSGVAGGPESDTATGLGPGEYYILFTEANGPNTGCVMASAPFTINQAPSLLDITATSTNDIDCADTGTISAIAQYGAGSYEYQLELDTAPAPNVATWTGTNTTGYFDNLVNDNYTVYVKDANNCIRDYDITVGLDPSPQISLAIVDECAPEGTFQKIVTLDVAGMPPYQISINGGPFQNITFDGSNQYTVSGLSSGMGQSISVRDLNGCLDTDPFDIIAPLEFTVMQTALLDCEPGAAANAEITIEVTSGSSNYDFEIDGPGLVDQPRTALPSNPFTWTGASAAGPYNVIIYDNNTSPPNCAQNVVIDVPNEVLPIFTETHIDVTCNGGADGSITLTEVDNGISPLTYTLTPMPPGVILVGNTFENVPAGTYDVRAAGTNSCFTDIFGIVINEPNVINIPAPTVVEFGCTSGNNPNNASITIDDLGITGGSGNYTIFEFINDQGTPAPGDDVIVQTGSNTTYIETDHAGGSYIINVYDSNGCVGTTNAIILPYDELLTATAAITNPLTCNPGLDGEITITVTSVNMDPTRFEYSINNGVSYQASNVFSGLDFGTHNFLIRHIDTGCIITATETILDPNTFTVDVTVVQDVVCFGTASGQVTLELVDATYVGPFDWNIYDTNGTPLNTADDVLVTNGTSPTNGPTAAIPLPEGEYLAELIQNNHPFCTNTSLFNIAGPPAAITANTDVTPITCIGNDGIIEIIDVLGGWGSYSYYVGTVPPTGPGDYVAGPQFATLPPGTYEAWVIDANGCEQMIQNNIVLADPAPITASLQINQENCTNIQGEIEVVAVIGGQGSNYTYQLIRDAAPFGAPQTTTVFSGLGAGTYEVQITDQWSCTFTTPPVTLYDEVVLVGNVIKPIDCTASPDGEITITATGGSGNFDYTVTFPDLVTTASNATGVFTGLSQAGTYTFVVSDLNTTPNCTYSVDMDLDAPTPVTFDPHTIVDVSCNGLSDGSITVNLVPTVPGVNDNPPYAYNLYSGALLIAGPQPDPTFAGLAAGTYDVEAVSIRGCSLRETVVVNEPNVLTATAVATPFACNPDNTVNTSTITVTVPFGAGTAPYLYSIDNINFQASNTFDIVDNGAVQNITVYVADANGCTTTTGVIIDPINVFTAVVSQDVAISCAGPEEVTITVTDDGNPANTYTFELLPIGNPNGVLTATPTNVTAEFDLTAVGSYTFRVTDTNTGCYFDTAPYTIAPYDLIDVVATATAPVICFGDTNGALEINVTGYTGPYSFEVFTDAAVSTGITGLGDTATNPMTINGLSGGNYFVRVTETNNPLCVEDSNIITIVSPDMPLTATINPVANVTCTNDQGEILVDPEGGFALYDIVLTNTTTTQVYNANGVNSFVFSGLSAGNFTIAITDAGGCVLNDVEVLIQPTPITADITAVPLALQCYEDTNATVTAINVLGGEGTYQYQLNYYDSTGTIINFSSGAQSSPVFNNIGAGIYSITVSDSWNCDVETVQVTITEPAEVEAALIQLSPMSCVNQAQLELSATGGTGPYEYSTDNVIYQPMSGGNTHVFNVTDGVYQYYVRDSFGCEANISNQISVDPIIPLSISLDTSAAMINCTGEATAVIDAMAFGGLGNYSYELFGDAALTNLLSGPQNDGYFDSLTAGSYWIRVTSIDCIEVTNEIIITEPVPLQIDRQESTNVSCSGQEDGSITVEVSGGTGNIYYAISPNLNKFDTVNVFTDLAPGVYDVIAQDENGCFIPFQFTITEPMPLDATFTSTPEVCIGSEDGTIDLTISGGTAPYRTALNSNLPADFIQDQTSFTSLAAGTYVIFVRDAMDCETNVIVQIDPGVNLNALVEPIYICDGDVPDNYLNVTMEDDTVLGSVMYALDSTDPADLQLDPDFTNISPGSHYLTISHANGCMQTIDFEIQSFEPLTLTLEQNNINEITAIATGGLQDYTFYFGDDNNGTDNTYYINRTDTYTVRVVDQNGCEMLAQIFMEFIDIEIPNYFTPDGDGMNEYWMPQNIEQWPEILIKIFDRYGREIARVPVDHYGWDGTYQGAELPTGDYWYVIKLQGENDDREFIGHFTLYR